MAARAANTPSAERSACAWCGRDYRPPAIGQQQHRRAAAQPTSTLEPDPMAGRVIVAHEDGPRHNGACEGTRPARRGDLAAPRSPGQFGDVTRVVRRSGPPRRTSPRRPWSGRRDARRARPPGWVVGPVQRGDGLQARPDDEVPTCMGSAGTGGDEWSVSRMKSDTVPLLGIVPMALLGRAVGQESLVAYDSDARTLFAGVGRSGDVQRGPVRVDAVTLEARCWRSPLSRRSHGL